MKDTTSAREAALKTRQDKALDRPVRLDGAVTTYRELIMSGRIAYTTERHHSDGSKTYGLITHTDIQSEAHRGFRDSLAFAAYWETPKLVADWPTLFPRLVTFGYNGIEIVLPDGTVSIRMESEW